MKREIDLKLKIINNQRISRYLAVSNVYNKQLIFIAVSVFLIGISLWSTNVTVDELGPIYPVESFLSEGNFDVDEYPSIRVNSFNFNGHWYSAFLPFFGFLVGPFRWIGDITANILVSLLQVFQLPEAALDSLHGTVMHSIQSIPSIVAVIAGSFIIVRILQLWNVNPRLQELARWTYVFGTTLRFYSISTWPHVIGSTLLLAAFYMVILIIRDENPSVLLPVTTGITLGCVVLIRETYSLLALVFIFVLLLYGRYRENLIVLISATPFAAIFFGYNWLLFGNIFTTPHALYGEATGRTGWIILPDGFWGNFLAPRASMFIFTPVFLLFLFGFLGLLVSKKRLLPEVSVLYLWIFLLAITASLARVWTGDYSWGPRYITEAIPPLLLLSWLTLDWICMKYSKINQTVIATGKITFFISLIWGVFINTTAAFISPWPFYSDLLSSSRINQFLYDEWTYNIVAFPHAVWNYDILVSLPLGRFSSAIVQAIKMISPALGNLFGYLLLLTSIALVGGFLLIYIWKIPVVEKWLSSIQET